MTEPITSFKDRYHFLSNLYPCHVHFTYLGIWWIAKSVEHLYQACKTRNVNHVRWIISSRHAGLAKIRGREVEIREDWNEMKDQVMEGALREKFAKPDLAQMLRATGDALLVEGNHWHDNYWGVCTCKQCEGDGENRLGRLLMKIRDEIR